MGTLALCFLGLVFPVAAALLWRNIGDGIAGMLVWCCVVIILMRHRLSLTQAIVPRDDNRRDQIAQVMYRGQVR
jgi:RsiW-degrading membrane proteinase PrsW (M82 family)